MSTTHHANGDLAGYALDFMRAGRHVLPLPFQSKIPVEENWSTLRIEEQDVSRYFPKNVQQNLGLLNGEPSRGLIDVDHDCREAVEAGTHLLPRTGWMSGRPSNPNSHAWYTVETTIETATFADTDGKMIVELRSTGTQTVVPPSTHPDGEQYTWHRREGEPAKVEAEELNRAVRLTAAAAIIAKHWPAKGSRHAASLALAGALLRAGWEVDATESFMFAVVDAAGDEEGRGRIRNVRSAAERQENDKKTKGWTSLKELLVGDGAKVVELAKKWLGLSDPKIILGNKKPTRIIPVKPYVPFPTEALPDPLRTFVKETSAAIGCDESYVALHVLACVASAIGNTRGIVVKPGWVELPILWCAVIGDSGTLKSPGLSAAIRPLLRTQKRLFNEFKTKLEECAKELREFKIAEKKYEAGKGPDPGNPPTAPTVRRLLCSDTTIEKLARILEQNPRGVLVFRDELSAWIYSFTKNRGKSGGSDAPNWLECHRGGTMVVDRVLLDRVLYVENASVSVCGGVQPGILARALTPEFFESGLVARLLVTMPPKRAKRWTENQVSPETEAAYRSLLERLLELDFQIDDDMEPTAHRLSMDREAKAEWIAFYGQWAERQQNADADLAAAFSKLEGYTARFALIHHVVSHIAAGEDDRCKIGVESIRAGIVLSKWFADETERVYATLSESEDEREARKLIAWVTDHGGSTTARDLQRKNSRKYRTAEEAEAALNGLVLSAYGEWCLVAPGPKGGAPSKRFFLLPTHDNTDTTRDQEDDDSDGLDSADTTPPRPPTPPPNAEDFEVPSVLSSVGKEKNENTSPQSRLNTSSNEIDAAKVLSDNPKPSPKNRQSGMKSEQRVAPTDDNTDTTPAKAEGCISEQMESFTLITNPGLLSSVAAALSDAPGERVFLDLETTGLDHRTDRTRLISLSIPAGEGRVTYLIDCFKVDPSPLFEALAECELVGHNLAFDLGFLSRLGFRPGKVRDTILLSQVLYASAHTKGVARVKHGLKDCLQREIGIQVDKDLQKSNWAGTLSPEQLAYAAGDVAHLGKLNDALSRKLAEAGLERVATLECEALPCLTWMATSGVPFDRAKWKELADSAAADVERLTGELNDVAPKRMQGLFDGTWNWDSPTIDVREVLALIGHPVESTGDEILAKIDHPVAKLLRDYRDARKRETTYGNEWAKKHVAGDDRIYPSWMQLGANSGRMSCGNPNMQNLPRGEYRTCFAAPAGRVLVKADYSQIELRIAAKVSNDVTLLAAYQRGDDLHTLTAKNVLGIQEVTKNDRQLAKAINFGLLYGMGSKAFKDYAKTTYSVELTEAQAGKYRDAFFNTYTGLKRWHRSIKNITIDTRTLIGRRVLKVDRFTEKLNLPIQGSGADGLKAALALLCERRDQVPGAFPILAVHDEIVAECDAPDAARVAAWVKQAMLDAMTPLIWPIPVEVEVKVGTTWGGD
ncbi:MAG: DUF3987 domain-containing protein [Gemmataceae bacterium]|nr:DUF3987 domain-containing protein [Gemmataceae bacterium]